MKYEILKFIRINKFIELNFFFNGHLLQVREKAKLINMTNIKYIARNHVQLLP